MEEWVVDEMKLRNEFIEIVGFTYEPKIKNGIPKEEPALEQGGNPHHYHAYYRLIQK